MAETAEELQNALNEFQMYCFEWKLTVNVDKTKIFSKGPMLKTKFYYNNLVIESVRDFKYLGVVFSRTGSFSKTKKHLYEQAQKAMYGIIKKIREFNLPLECQLDFFDKVVVPVLLDGSKVWGFENFDLIERLHLHIFKICIEFKKFHTSVHGVWPNRSFSPVYFLYAVE